MATTPIFSANGQVANNNATGMNQPITLAANDFTGANANNSLAFTTDVNGSYVKKLRFKAAGTNIATVARIFLNNGLTPATATNNTFFGEISLPATTASATSATGPDVEYTMEIALPSNFRIYVSLATAVASGWVVTPIAGDF